MTEEGRSSSLCSREKSSSKEYKSSEHPSNPPTLTQKPEIQVTKGGHDRGKQPKQFVFGEKRSSSENRSLERTSNSPTLRELDCLPERKAQVEVEINL